MGWLLALGLAVAEEPVSAGTPEAAASPWAAPAATPTEPTPTPGVGGVKRRPDPMERIAAVVNDEVILLSEVYAYADFIAEQVGQGVTRGAAERSVIERLVESALVEQEMRRLGLEVNDQEIDRAIDDVARRNGLEREQLRAEVERGGYTWDDYRARLAEDLGQMKFGQTVLRPRVNVTENELKDAYLRATASTAQEARVRAIFLALPPDGAVDPVLARAEAIRARVAAGEDFGALSSQLDEGPFGAQSGEMGRFKPGELVGALDTAVQGTATGAVSAPVVTDRGVFLLEVVERVAAVGDFEAMRAQLENDVFASRMVEEQERWFQQARRQAAVTILIPEAAAVEP